MNPTADEYDWDKMHQSTRTRDPSGRLRTVNPMSDWKIRKLDYSGDEKLLRLVGQRFMNNESN
jgi:hypothetical protein